MLENYLDKMDIRLEDMKNYIYTIDPQHYDESLESCFMIKQFKEKFNPRKEYYLQCALTSLMKAEGINEMENHLIMMNYFFEKEPKFCEIKRALKKLVLTMSKPVNQYRILRHIMNVDTETLIELLVNNHYMNYEQAAYCSLIENKVENAYDYLAQMSTIPHQEVMDLFYSYSPMGYLQLKRKFKKQAIQYVCAIN